MTTDIQKFRRALKRRHFESITVARDFLFATTPLIPSVYKTTDKDIVVTANITVVVFGGSNIKKGDLGCVCFYFGGKKKPYRCRHTEQSEILKKAFCPKSVKEALTEYDLWHTECKNTMKEWKELI